MDECVCGDNLKEGTPKMSDQINCGKSFCKKSHIALHKFRQSLIVCTE